MSARVTQAIQLLRGIPGVILVQLLRGFPGILLVTAGGLSIYFSVVSAGGTTPASISYLVVAFGFFVALAGIILLFRELGQAGAERAGFDPTRAASDIERVVAQLTKNYDILRQQTRAGFVLAAVFMALGILVILAGAAGQLLGIAQGATGVAALVGIIIEAVSVLGFYLFRTSFKELTATSERLHEVVLLLAAFKRAEALPDEQKTQVTMELIQRLVEYARNHHAAAHAKTA